VLIDNCVDNSKNDELIKQNMNNEIFCINNIQNKNVDNKHIMMSVFLKKLSRIQLIIKI